MSTPFTRDIIRQLTEIQEGGSWLAESYKAKIDKLGSADAFRRPIPEIHSVAELIWHVAIWRVEGMRRLRGQKFDLMNSPDNWRDNDELRKIGWEGLKDDFNKSLSDLISTLETLSVLDLELQYLDTQHTMKHLIEGLVHHDLYH